MTPLWNELLAQPAAELRDRAALDGLPELPGVYAVFRGGEAVYVGKARSLLRRIRGNHCGGGSTMTGSALRRNVAEMLGIASPGAIKSGAYVLSDAEVAAVKGWIAGCTLRYLTCASEAAALDHERGLKAEWRPRLTKR